MKTFSISQDEFDDFMDEPDTTPATSIIVVQAELNSMKSVASFTSMAESLGYKTNVSPKHWTEKLLDDLDDHDHHGDDSDIIFEDQV